MEPQWPHTTVCVFNAMKYQLYSLHQTRTYIILNGEKMESRKDGQALAAEGEVGMMSLVFGRSEEICQASLPDGLEPRMDRCQ